MASARECKRHLAKLLELENTADWFETKFAISSQRALEKPRFFLGKVRSRRSNYVDERKGAVVGLFHDRQSIIGKTSSFRLEFNKYNMSI